MNKDSLLADARQRLLFKYAALVLVIGLGAAKDIVILFNTSVAVGLDGYYYVLQVEGLTSGQLFFNVDAPLILYFLTGIRYLVGNTIVAVKVGAVILHVLLCVGIAALLIRSTANWWLAVLGGGYASLAGLHYYMLGEFIRNLGALTLITAGLMCITWPPENRKLLWYSVSLLCFLAALGSHRSTILIVSSIALMGCWAHFFHLAALARNKRLLLMLFLTALILYLSPYLCATQPFFQISPTLMSELSSTPRLPFTRLTVFDSLILCLAAPLVLILRFWQSKTYRCWPHILFSAVALSTILFSLNAFISPDSEMIEIAGRLQTFIYIQVALLLPYALWMVGNVRPGYKVYGGALAVPLLLLGMQTELPLGMTTRYLADRERLIEVSPAIGEVVPQGSVIMAAHGEEFVVTATTGISARSTWSKHAKSESIYWMLRAIPRSIDLPIVKELISEPNGTSRILAKHADLGNWWRRAKPEQRQKLMVGNSHLRNFLKLKETGVLSEFETR